MFRSIIGECRAFLRENGSEPLHPVVHDKVTASNTASRNARKAQLKATHTQNPEDITAAKEAHEKAHAAVNDLHNVLRGNKVSIKSNWKLYGTVARRLRHSGPEGGSKGRFPPLGERY